MKETLSRANEVQDEEVHRALHGIEEIPTKGKDNEEGKRTEKAFSLEDLEELVGGAGSPDAVYQATRIFTSKFDGKKAEKFYNLVLLPRVREDISKNKQLHPSLYKSLHKALHKPGAFFRGILFPLCKSRTCTIREAAIFGSIIEKVSIPPPHSSAMLLKLAGMEYCGTTSYFMRLLVEKNYALPYAVVDAVVAHFMRFLTETKIMPLICHQLLLAFVQRYKNDLRREDKDNLRGLLAKQNHKLVTSEINFELNNCRTREEK